MYENLEIFFCDYLLVCDFVETFSLKIMDDDVRPIIFAIKNVPSRSSINNLIDAIIRSDFTFEKYDIPLKIDVYRRDISEEFNKIG
jgi:hypothetical protein